MSNEKKLTEDPDITIITVDKLIEDCKFIIPEYQRPYKWEAKNVIQMLDDINEYSGGDERKVYRLGTIIVHKDKDKDKDKLNIVDGQQRLTTLALILHYLGKDKAFLKDAEYPHSISHKNIQNNYITIKNWFLENKHNNTFFEQKLKSCQFVVVSTESYETAFNLFDSQNTRGKELEAFDLLKAYHLRELGEHVSECTKMQIVYKWELLASPHTFDRMETCAGSYLQLIFNYLYRIRCLTKNNSCNELFSKENINIFKQLGKVGNYPVFALFNSHSGIDYFKLNQPIVNGERFFSMIFHYVDSYKQIIDFLKKLPIKINDNREIDYVQEWGKLHSKSDRRAFEAYICALFIMLDNFGQCHLDNESTIHLFKSIYSIRANYKNLQFKYLCNMIKEKQVFLNLLYASSSYDIKKLHIYDAKKDKEYGNSELAKMIFEKRLVAEEIK